MECNLESWAENIKRLWSEGVCKTRFSCNSCAIRSEEVEGNSSVTYSHYLVCLVDEKNMITRSYYAVAVKDLFEQHRRLEGTSTINLTPVLCAHLCIMKVQREYRNVREMV